MECSSIKESITDFLEIISPQMDVWTASFAAIAALLYLWYHKRNIRSLEESGIPMIPSLPIIGSIHKLIGKGLIQSEGAWLKEYGNVIGWYNGYVLNVVTADRDMINEILVKKFNIFSNRWVSIQNGNFSQTRSSYLISSLTDG
ncbi:uncharacterized protein LOC110441616 isoform X2 [Mizuhopecten yessoensis]|uniref:uncharacterized protein LOC110441616 isoform X2 n=1 Tax=Mizuhopecten yessoensis TaxID=6573 RepID=UPI000B45B0BF|nr:uncharacterized protein LOC110441616 isoform X2 [Mizuhopecten yessoensis]